LTATISNLSVIIPAHNAERTIEPCLGALLRSTIRPREILVVDDASTDRTREIAAGLGARVIEVQKNAGPGPARNLGAEEAAGNILVFVDSDIMVPERALESIEACFRDHPEANAITGHLDGGGPVRGYFSRYKNRYMAYVFSKLPKHVEFIYTSAAAVRREAFPGFGQERTGVEDTEMGIRLSQAGHIILLCDGLAVTHLKEYTFWSFIKNDFNVPRQWAKIFLRNFSLGGIVKKRGFAHARPTQIAGLCLASAAVLTGVPAAVGSFPWWVAAVLAIGATLTHVDLLISLARTEGPGFALAGVVVGFIDQLVMTLGIAYGLVCYALGIDRGEAGPIHGPTPKTMTDTL
jgi:GT2 family glycosyltransferase